MHDVIVDANLIADSLSTKEMSVFRMGGNLRIAFQGVARVNHCQIYWRIVKKKGKQPYLSIAAEFLLGAYSDF